MSYGVEYVTKVLYVGTESAAPALIIALTLLWESELVVG